LEWGRPIQLRDGSRQNLIYSVDQSKLPKVAGVYVFGRHYGNNFEALYEGKANGLHGRIKGQLKNLPLMLHLKNCHKRLLRAIAHAGLSMVVRGSFRNP
jgi:hypothetical protein